MSVSLLPTVNASLNALAAFFLILGWRAIKLENRELHKKCMIAALICSTAFLITYVSYHIMVPGVTRYPGTGIARFIYFSILLTHTPLAIAIVPFSLMALRYALKGAFAQHVLITRWLLPVWLYVSVTGVMIYFMLYVF